MVSSDPKWLHFREQLIALSKSGDHEWLDEASVKSIVADAYLKGLSPQLITSCRAAASSAQEFAERLGALVARPRIRILFIDDERPLLNLIKLNLEKTGRFEVATEDNSTRWRERIAEVQPDLVILDMVMPGVDGREILHCLRADAVIRHLPVIVLTAILENSDASAVNNDGTLFLAKPIGLKALVHCIEEHVGAGVGG